jgi:chemotaxis protein CheD
MQKYYLHPGFIFVSEQPYYIHTVLGSCVSVCVWDVVRKYGGMNHYIYSKPFGSEYNARFGIVSIRYLLKLMAQNGSLIQNLRAHIIGGGYSTFAGPAIGEANREIAEEILGDYGIMIVTKDTGGQTGRKVVFNNYNGEIIVYKGIDVRKGDWYNGYEKQDQDPDN